MKEKPIQGHPHESLRLYLLCKSMRWTHLPVPGGLYDQHPRLLDHWQIIQHKEAEVQRDKDRKNMGPQGSKGSSLRSRKPKR